MDWNILILAGFVLRIIYAVANEEYEFSFSSPAGINNIRKKMVSLIFAVIVWYLSFFYHADDMINDGPGLIAMWGIYITIGWAIDSLWIAFTTFIEQKLTKGLK